MWWPRARCAPGRDDGPPANDWAKPSPSRSRYHRESWSRPVAGAPVFFHEGPEYITLHLCHMQTMHDIFAHSSRMLPGHVQPVEDRVRFTRLDPADGP